MGRMYTAGFEDIAASALQDVFELLAATGKTLIVHSWSVAQTSDVGDAQEEILRLVAKRGVGATSGSGGSTVTPRPLNVNDSAAGATVERNNTTQAVAGGGSLTELEFHGWNVRGEFAQIYTPETRPIVHPGNTWVLSIQANPADSITLSATLTFEEI